MKRTLFAIAFTAINLFLLLAVMSSAVLADDSCTGQYGQYGNCPPSQSITVDKFVGMPNQTKGGSSICDGSVSYRDNFAVSDPRFTPNNFVCFQVKVKNTSNVTLHNVVFKDFLPGYVNAVEGPGSFDNTNKLITYTIGDIPSGTENTYYLKAQIYAVNLLPADKGLMCLVNKAQAYNDQVSDDDTAQFCVEKQVTPGTKTPSSGPEFGLILLAANGVLAGVGLTLKRLTSKK